jgi:hypothetical protein
MLATPITSLSITLTAPRAVALIHDYWVEKSVLRFATAGFVGNAMFFGLDLALLPVVKSISEAAGASQRQCLNKAARAVANNAENISFFVAYLIDILLQRKYELVF